MNIMMIIIVNYTIFLIYGDRMMQIALSTMVIDIQITEFLISLLVVVIHCDEWTGNIHSWCLQFN